MKTYEVEIRRTSFFVVTVEAKDEDEAESKAWEEVQSRADTYHASWDIESIEEINNA